MIRPESPTLADPDSSARSPGSAVTAADVPSGNCTSSETATSRSRGAREALVDGNRICAGGDESRRQFLVSRHTGAGAVEVDNSRGLEACLEEPFRTCDRQLGYRPRHPVDALGESRELFGGPEQVDEFQRGRTVVGTLPAPDRPSRRRQIAQTEALLECSSADLRCGNGVGIERDRDRKRAAAVVVHLDRHDGVDTARAESENGEKGTEGAEQASTTGWSEVHR